MPELHDEVDVTAERSLIFQSGGDQDGEGDSRFDEVGAVHFGVDEFVPAREEGKLGHGPKIFLINFGSKYFSLINSFKYFDPKYIQIF